MQHYNHIKMKTPPYALLKRLSSVGKDLTQFTQVAYECRHNYILLSFICFLFISFFSLSFVSYFYCGERNDSQKYISIRRLVSEVN